MKLDFNGLIAAGFSPFKTNGTPDLEKIPPLVDKLIEEGINGFYLMGSTGEGVSVKVEQRMLITEAYFEAVNNRVPIIVNVTHSSYEASGDLSRHAVEMGAEAISATAPSYYGIPGIRQLIYAVEKIADSQDQIPFIYYHIPGKTGLNFKMYHFLEELDQRIPQLGGIKYTATSMDDFMICKENYGDRYKMFFGVDEFFLPALAMQADTFIGSTYNFMLPYYKNILKYYGTDQHDLALKNYGSAVEIINAFLKYDGLAAQKAILKMIGYDFGVPKSPVIALSDQDYAALKKDLESLHYFDHVK